MLCLSVKLSGTEGVSGLGWSKVGCPSLAQGQLLAFGRAVAWIRGHVPNQQSGAKVTRSEITRTLLCTLGCRLQQLAAEPFWHHTGVPLWLSRELVFQICTRTDAFN